MFERVIVREEIKKAPCALLSASSRSVCAKHSPERDQEHTLHSITEMGGRNGGMI